MKIMKSYGVFVVMLALTLLAGVLLASSHAIADNDSVVDEINITVPVSCTLSGVGMDTHNATINNGQYNSTIGESTIKAFCNDSEGFSIYAIGYTDNTDGKNVLTNSTLGSTYDIATGTLTTGSNSQWAMKLSTITSPAPTYPIIIAGSTADTEKAQGDPDFTSFQEVPDDYERVAYRTSSTDINPQGQSTAEGSTIKSTYQAYISSTQPAGTYTGQVKYTMVHPYNAMAPEKPPVTIATATYLQEVNACPAGLTTGQIFTLLDSRDGQSYKVAKLADDKCWMLENMALDPTDATTAGNMNELNTNASAAAISNYLQGGSNTSGWSSVAVADVDSNFGSYTEPRINNASTDSLVTSYGTAAVNGQAKVGVYYNFCAATVGTYCYNEDDGVDIPDSLIDASEDICPSNWRMPTGGASYPNLSDYLTLVYALGLGYYDEDDAVIDENDVLMNTLSTSLSGEFSGNSASYQNQDGHWWSSTISSYGYYGLGLTVSPYYGYSGQISLNAITGRNAGLTVRCLFKD